MVNKNIDEQLLEYKRLLGLPLPEKTTKPKKKKPVVLKTMTLDEIMAQPEPGTAAVEEKPPRGELRYGLAEALNLYATKELKKRENKQQLDP